MRLQNSCTTVLAQFFQLSAQAAEVIMISMMVCSDVVDDIQGTPSPAHMRLSRSGTCNR